MVDEIRDSLESIKESTRQSVALQMRILNELGEGVLIEDKNGKIIFTNPSSTTLLDSVSYKIIGKKFFDFLPQEEQIRVKNIIKRIISGKTDSIKFEAQLVQKSGSTIHVLVYYSLMKTDNKLEGALITLNDISDIKSLSKTIQERSNELIQTEKMASIGLLASGVAHELNNPLAYIISNTNTIEDYIKILLEYLNAWEALKNIDSNKLYDTKKFEHIDYLFDELDIEIVKEDIFNILDSNRRGLNRLSEVITDLRLFSHSHTNEKLEPIKMSAFQPIKIALNLLAYELNDIEVQFEPVENLFILGTARLYQVFLNILHNGIQSINESNNKGIIIIEIINENEKIKIQISDNGKGFSSEEELSKIFEPFFTSKEPGIGTGLGLSIAQRIIKDHDGYIIAEPSTKLCGASFSIYFPKYTDN